MLSFCGQSRRKPIGAGRQVCCDEHTAACLSGEGRLACVLPAPILAACSKGMALGHCDSQLFHSHFVWAVTGAHWIPSWTSRALSPVYMHVCWYFAYRFFCEYSPSSPTQEFHECTWIVPVSHVNLQVG